MLKEVIKSTAKPQSTSSEDLRLKVAVSMGRTVSKDEFRGAIDDLIKEGDIKEDNDQMARDEPNPSERTLESLVKPYVQGDWICQELNLKKEDSVFYFIGRGGAGGTGMFSRPDFTIATVRRFKYDPIRHLDVITFELKTLGGATLMGVHEALAHRRFGHYSFLICPRSRIYLKNNAELRDACANHGLGLIMFDLLKSGEALSIKHINLLLRPIRAAADPYVVEEFLEARLPKEELKKLIDLVQK